MLAGVLALVAFGLVAHLPALPDALPLFAGALTFTLIFLARPQWRWSVYLALLLLFGWRGVDWGAAQLQNRINPSLEAKELVVEGYVDGLPQSQPNYQRFEFRVLKAYDADGQPLPEFPAKIRLNAYRSAPLEGGSVCKLKVRLKQPRGMVNPGAFDYELWLLNRNIGATGYVRRIIAVDSGVYWRAGLSRLRETLRQTILDRLGSEARITGVVLALALGDRSRIDPRAANTIRQAGLSHLLAISGLHVGLVSGLGFVLGRVLGGFVALLIPGRVFGPRWGLVFAGLLAGGYALLSGFGIPAQRALIMLLVWSLWYLRNQRSSAWHNWWLALVLVLWLQPLALLEAGFWLSFLAVATLLLCSGYRTERRGRTLRALFAAQIWLFLLLAGTQVYWGLGISVHAIWINLLAVPYISLIVVPLVLLSMSAMLLQLPLVEVCTRLLRRALEAFWCGLDLADDLSGLDYIQPVIQLQAWQLVLISISMFIILIPVKMQLRGLAASILVLAVRIAGLPHHETGITILDVGQGLAVVAQSGGETLLYDTGPAFSANFNAGDAVILPYLRWNREDRLQYLILSHNDLDHRGGLKSVLNNLPVQTLIRGETAAEEEPPWDSCDADRDWYLGNIRVVIIGLGASALSWEGNNRSCVVLLETAGVRMLIPGDIEIEREWALLAHPELQKPIDILLAPHHGSKTSSSRRWIDALQPRRVIFSAAYRSRYRHPNPEVLERYQRSGAQLSCTSASGAQLIQFDGRGHFYVQDWRLTERRYWRYTDAPDCQLTSQI